MWKIKYQVSQIVGGKSLYELWPSQSLSRAQEPLSIVLQNCHGGENITGDAKRLSEYSQEMIIDKTLILLSRP